MMVMDIMQTEDKPRVILSDIDMPTAQRDFGALVQKHHEEVDIYQDIVKLNVDWESYEMLYEKGHILALGAYEISTCGQVLKPVGYIMDVIAPSLHYKDTVFATNDVLYVDPAYRNTGLGGRLIQASELKLKRLGVRVRTANFKATHLMNKLAQSQNFIHLENVHAKLLED